MKKQIVTLSLMLAIGLAGCGNATNNTADIPEGMALDVEELTVDTEPVAEDDSLIDETVSDGENTGNLTEEQALTAVKNYCYSIDPSIEKMDQSGKNEVSFDIESSSDEEIVVLFKANTGEEARFYVDPVSGDATITSFIPGEDTQEETIDEIAHLRDYLNGKVEVAGSVSLEGMWVTASMVPDADGEVAPEWHVEFAGDVINYGHLKDEEFAVDHSDEVECQTADSEGNVMVQAVTADGIQYTYKISASDKDVLEYYESWNEDDFDSTYSASGSLTRM
jgi:hypothetical protein